MTRTQPLPIPQLFDGRHAADYHYRPDAATVAGAAATARAQHAIRPSAADETRIHLLLIDVLPAPRRPDGMRPGTPWLPLRHRTLPGSLWWPEVGRGGLAPEVEAKFRARLAQVAAPNRLVVFFCLNDCWMSWNAAKRAASYGIRAAWYTEGVDGWEVAGLPLQDAAPEALD